MDNHHVQIWTSHMSCGVIELSSLTSDPKKVLYAVATYLYHPARGQPAAVLLWSDIEDSNGQALYDFIRRNVDPYLGIDECVPRWENPKTGNMCSDYRWEIQHNEFKQWYINERIERAKKL